MDTRYWLESSNLSIDRDNRFSLDSHNSKKDRTLNPRGRNNHKAYIHCQKPS